MSIRFPRRDDVYYVHRVCNFAEDLYRRIELRGLGTVKDIDRATDWIAIEVFATRHLGEARAILRQELRRHSFEVDAVVTRE